MHYELEHVVTSIPFPPFPTAHLRMTIPPTHSTGHEFFYPFHAVSERWYTVNDKNIPISVVAQSPGFRFSECTYLALDIQSVLL